MAFNDTRARLFAGINSASTIGDRRDLVKNRIGGMLNNLDTRRANFGFDATAFGGPATEGFTFNWAGPGELGGSGLKKLGNTFGITPQSLARGAKSFINRAGQVPQVQQNTVAPQNLSAQQLAFRKMMEPVL